MSEPVRTHLELGLLPVITVFPMPLRYRTLSLPFVTEDSVVVPSQVDHVDVSVEYYRVPSQFFDALFKFRVKLLGELKVR